MIYIVNFESRNFGLFCLVKAETVCQKNAMRRLTFALFFIFAFSVFGVPVDIDAKKIKEAENIMWSRFFVPKTNLFYECLTSFDEKTCQSHLPTAEEVKRQYPNPCGYATGMEDCAIVGGVVLAALSDHYAATKDESLKLKAKKTLDGLEQCVMPDGFVARGLCAEDGKSVYINSSVDQYTHCIHGMWRYYRSPMCDEADKAKIKGALLRIAARLERNVVEKNNYDSLRYDGRQCALKISRFTCERPHAAARLAMAYAAAWSVSGDEHYRRLYRALLGESVSVSEKIAVNSYTPIYSFLQMQVSLEVLRELETDEQMRARIKNIMTKVANLCVGLMPRFEKRFDSADTAMLYGDWRKPEKIENRNGYMIPKLGESRNVWRIIRESGEIPLVLSLAPDFDFPASAMSFFKKATDKIDYGKCASCGVIFHYAAYWSMMKNGASAK